MTKKLFTIILFLSIAISGVVAEKAVDSHISGHVIDKKTGQHVPFINIIIRNTTIGTTTDATGHYMLSNLPVGKFTIAAEGIGYVTVEKAVEIQHNTSIEVNFDVEEDVLKLDEVIVTAGRTEQKRMEAPVMVNTISTKRLETTHSVVLGEGLNFCTGLRYENDCQNCGFSQVRMNGMEGHYSQILINSRPIFSGLAGVYGLELIPANMLERIEVVRGGGSVLYGSNAIAGTINLILKDPKSNSFEAGANASLMGVGVKGSNGPTPDYNINFSASLVTEDRRSGLAVYGNTRDRGIFDANGDEFSEIAPMKNTVFGARLFHRPTYRSKLSLDFFNIAESRDGGSDVDKPYHERRVSESVSHDMKTGALTFEQFFRESDILSVFASGQYLNRDSYYGANYSLSDYGNTVDKTYNLGVQYKAAFNRSSLIGGVEHTGSHLIDKKLGSPDYENAVIENNEIVEVPHKPNTIVSDQSLTTTGAFAQYEIKLGKFKLLAGGRLDYYNIEDKQSDDDPKSNFVFIPRASVMYDVLPYLQARLGYSSGYRAPQIFDEDLHIETSGSRQVINRNDPNLKQENSSSFTLSLDFNKRIGNVSTGLLIEGFYTQLHNPFRNEIGEPDENGTVVYTRMNSESGAVVKGMNIELKLIPVKDLTFTSGFTVQSSKYGEADDTFGETKFFRTPNAYGFFTLDWDITPRFGVSANGNYTGKMLVPYFGTELQNPEEGELRPSNNFFDAGLKLHYNFSLGSGVIAQLYGGVKNVFNSYQSDFDEGMDRDPSYIYGPTLPRTIYAGFKISL
ncbi:TonB-dependent receptor [Paludibacter sp. 221]|uniref:TonB-dependent receptor n=1 Tax=Paludibacter sp. 221 TaxID=2302939 RepID=UPI0013D84F2F|nr:TonB-dependent receptor [Paludibacter sp. 221]NDV45549.1 TonB-dependent receptor [Paludibacter sp. 221]